ncbi:MAG: hypothetical protein AAF652_18705 [Cyanobacteria bacterium P01_C01_bin.72]
MHSKITLAFLCCLSTSLMLTGISTPVTAQSFSSVDVAPEELATAKQLSVRSQAKAEIQNYRGAIADISQAIRLNPNEADFYYQRGLILRELSARASALQDFDDAILRDPNHARAYLQRAGMSFDLRSSFQIRNNQGFLYRFDNIDGDRRGNARAILDLQTARDLFAQQGDAEGYQTADFLLRHFAGDLEPKENSAPSDPYLQPF